MSLEFIIPLLFFFSAPAQTELQDGFYLTVDCAVRGEIKRKNMLDERKTVCLPQHPFVALTEIEGVSAIVGTQFTNHFDVFISPKAVGQFNTMRAALKNATIALVVDNKVVFLIASDDHIEQTLRVIVFTETQQLSRARTKIIDQLAKAKE